MKNSLVIFLILNSFVLFSQQEFQKNDTLFGEIKIEQVFELGVEIGMIRIIDNNLWTAKGFIPISKDDTTFNNFTQFGSDSCRIVAEIIETAKGLYQINYKNRNQDEFNSGLYYLYNCDYIYYIAIPVEKINHFRLEYTFQFIPSSSDERDVVFQTKIGNSIYFYEWQSTKQVKRKE